MKNQLSTTFPLIASLVTLPLLLTACVVEDLDDMDLVADDAALDEEQDSFRADPQIWEPLYLDPQLCLEGEYSYPPAAGKCVIDIRLIETEFVTGQGVSEGRGEISTIVTATDPNGVQTVATVDTLTYDVGQDEGHNLPLGTYAVPVGQTRNVSICADFTEHDNGGSNGVDDIGSACKTVKLVCHPSLGQPSFTATVGPATLCGDNQCNGSASARVEVMRADADFDGIPNIEDFTPEPCDEHEKSNNGTGLLLYYHYDDNKFSSLAQSLGSDIDRHYGAYDYVVLVADNETSNPMDTMGAAFADADAVFPPTRAGIMDAMRHLTAEGYRFDVKTHTHGKQNGGADSSLEVLSGWRVSGEWLFDATEPDEIGTARGGIPIVALWGTTCWQARQIDAWSLMGAKVASGAIDTNFYPNAWLNYWDAWVAGTQYRTAVDDSVTALVVSTSAAYIEAEGALAPWFCTQLNSVLLANACAEDFFTKDVSDPNDTHAYRLEDIYDNSLSGADNMAVASTRVFMGNQQLTFGGGQAFWP